MRYGVCVGDNSSNVKIAAECGFDYVESCFSLLTTDDEEKYTKFQNALKENSIPCESVNCFLPGSLPVIGENVDEEALKAYIEKGMKKGCELGVKTVVFGSSGARHVPEGYSFADGVRQMVHCLKDIIAPIAKKYGITVVIEPLRKIDTNFINKVTEGAYVASAADCDEIKLLGDLYHMHYEHDEYCDVRLMKGLMHHSHIANPIGRVYPADVNEYDYKGFIEALEYAGCVRCSVEAGTDDFAKDAAAAIKVLRAI